MNTLKTQAHFAMQNYAKFLPISGLLLASLLLPKETQNFQIRNISKPMVIQTSKVEPPRVAFDEIVSSHVTTKNYTNQWNVLRSSGGVSVNLNQQSRLSPKITGLQLIQNRKVYLSEMSFSRDQALADIQARRQKEIETREWVASLDPQEQERVIAAQEKSRVLEQDWAPTDVRVEARQLIEQVRADIQGQEQNQESKIQVSFTDTQGVTKTSADRSRPTVTEVTENKPAVNTGYVAAGTVSLPVGGPMLPGYQVRVSRHEDGRAKESVIVDPRSNKYSMPIADLNGALVAELVDGRGDVIGEGSRRISRYDVAQIHNMPLIKMKARQSSSAGVIAAFDGRSSLTDTVSGKEKGVKSNLLYASLDTESSTDESGSFQVNQLMKGSWTLMRTENKDYYPALFMTEAGVDRKLPVFTKKMITALKQIVADQKVMSDVEETGSVVWGQISHDGKALAGVQVDVEFLDQYQTVYFNSLLIPDPSLKATSENGYFAILNLPAGFHALIATRGAQYFSHSNVVVDENAISIAEIQSAFKKDLVQLKVFDAFTGNAGLSQLQMQSLPEMIEVNGIAALDLPDISRQSFLTSRPLDPRYLETLQVYNDADEYVHVPLINKAWLESVKGSQKISFANDTATIVGFVESDDYEVYLPHSESYPQDHRIFFDAQGQPTPKSVQGGGFILFNVPAGVQSVVVVKQETDMMNSQVIPADVDSTVVLRMKF